MWRTWILQASTRDWILGRLSELFGLWADLSQRILGPACPPNSVWRYPWWSIYDNWGQSSYGRLGILFTGSCLGNSLYSWGCKADRKYGHIPPEYGQIWSSQNKYCTAASSSADLDLGVSEMVIMRYHLLYENFLLLFLYHTLIICIIVEILTEQE